jgi:hypothetical protein
MKVRGSKTINGVNQPDLARGTTLQSVLTHVHGPLPSGEEIWSCVNDAFENVFRVLPPHF